MQSEKIMNMPNVNTLLKISLGLIIVAIISSAFVYAETASVNIDGTSYDFEYTGDGVSITGVDADIDFPTLLLSVDVTGSPGILEITLERSFFDSTYLDTDDDFFVLVDGLDIEFDEEKTDTARILTMELPSGTEDVEIIGSVFGTGVVETPVEEEPPVVETPVEEEPPVVETPTEKPNEKPTTTPPVTTPKETKPMTECGPGTILKDGVCVLDQRCGPGTILQDDECVLAPQPTTSFGLKGMGIGLVIATIAGFIIAGTVGLILALISKASKSKNN